MVVSALVSFNSYSQPPLFKSPAYINHYSEEAVNQMIEYKIPASVIIAQAIFESNCGTSYLAKKSNNHFGIKCHTGWIGDTIVKTDDSLNECFRRYENVEESYTDHSKFLKSRLRYAGLFKLSVLDYKGWCIGLKACGYATYPTYAEQLIKIIEENKLTEIDKADKIKTGTVYLNKDKGIVPGKLLAKEGIKKEFISSEALFIDEKYGLIQSLELIIISENDEDVVKQ